MSGRLMKYKKAKEIVENDFGSDNVLIKFGWKFRFIPRLRKAIKHWAEEVLEND